MDPTKTTQTPAGAPDAAAAGMMSVPGAETPASVTPGALDFTGNSANGLSMADSLASAQDNLTSAGMAANDAGNATLDLSQLSSSDPQATMNRPEEPLVPAAPVPGSIGSVTSGPAAMADPAAPAAADAATTPYNPFATPAAPQAQQPAVAQAAPVATQAAQPDMSQTSSTNVPTALQPKTSKFSMKGGKSSMLTWILGIAAGVFAIATIVFMVLWIQGMGNEKIVYVPNTVRPEPVQTSATCVMEREAGAEDGMEGLMGIASTVNLNFMDDSLTNYDVLARYTFGEAAQAEASRSLFATMVSLFSAVDTSGENSPLSASYNVADNVVTLDMKTDVESALEIDNITLDLPQNEGGEYLLDAASVKDHLANQGYVCE